MNAQSKKQPESKVKEYGEVIGPRAVRLERLLPGPIKRVWAYLTESEKRKKWFAEGPMELRPGGKIEFVFHNSELAPEGEPTPERYQQYEGMVSHGRVLRCEPPHVLSFMWGETPEEESEVTFELSERGDQVHLVLTHSQLPNRKEMVSVASGWDVHVGVLIDRLNGRELQPFWSRTEQLEAEYDKRFPADEQ